MRKDESLNEGISHRNEKKNEGLGRQSLEDNWMWIWVWEVEGKGIPDVYQIPSLGDLDGYQWPRWRMKKKLVYRVRHGWGHY